MKNGIADNRADQAAEMAGGDRDADIAQMPIGEQDIAGDLFENGFAEYANKKKRGGDAISLVGLLRGFESPEKH